ncbi:MAG: 50S ribosomal protein L11 methyltransferase [Cyclobacteriaceae bacterium]
MNFLEISIEIPTALSDELSALLAEKKYDSFLETDSGINAYINSELYDEKALTSVLTILSVEPKFKVNRLENKNWNEEWEKNYDPVIIGTDIQIRAPFHKSAGCTHEILITPKMSFGTGHHATTSLMLQHQLTIVHTNKKVVDAGCGTGVLAIMAELRGSTDVTAYDIDEWSYENTLENIASNNCEHIRTYLCDSIDTLPEKEKRDIILANINKNVLLNEIPNFALRLTKGGKLLMSGFFIEDNNDIEQSAKKAGLHLTKSSDDGKWSSLVFTK